MATKDKLPTFEQIWGSPPPSLIKVGPHAYALVAKMAKRASNKKRKPAKGKRK